MKCDGCEYRLALSATQTGRKLEFGNGKCVREGGFCDEMDVEFQAMRGVENPSVVLPVVESKRLCELEGVIQENISGFLKVGSALMEIRDRRLYRAEFETFEEYCQVKWDMGRRYANYQIEAVNVVERIKANGNHGSQIEDENHGSQSDEDVNENHGSQIDLPEPILPTCERQTRPLTALGPEAQILVWKKVLEKAEDRRITAALVARTAAEMTKGFTQEKIKKKDERISREEKFSRPFRRGFQTFLNEVSAARAANWKETSKQAALKHIDELRRIVAED